MVKPGVLQSMRSQRVGLYWVTELKLTWLENLTLIVKNNSQHCCCCCCCFFSCVQLCNPRDGSPPDSSPGFSRQEHWSGLPLPSPVHACMLSRFIPVQFCTTPWTTAQQAPLVMGFSRQEFLIIAKFSYRDFFFLWKNFLNFLCKNWEKLI